MAQEQDNGSKNQYGMNLEGPRIILELGLPALREAPASSSSSSLLSSLELSDTQSP